MRSRALRLAAASLMSAFAACASAQADEDLYPPAPAPGSPAPAKPDDQPPPKPKTAAEIREDIYARLAAAKDADETDGLVRLLLGSYSQSGSDTADLLLRRAHTAIEQREYATAEQILDAAVAIMPDWAEGWNARATLRYLDDDYDGSMTDIAETLKREPRHIGALSGMAMILEAHGEYENALKVYQHALDVAPQWKKAEDAVKRLKAKIAGQEL